MIYRQKINDRFTDRFIERFFPSLVIDKFIDKKAYNKITRQKICR